MGQESLKAVVVDFAGARKAAFENFELLNIWDILLKEQRLGILKSHWSEEVGKMGVLIFQSGRLLARYYLFPATGQF